jgi:hypothetical protein
MAPKSSFKPAKDHQSPPAAQTVDAKQSLRALPPPPPPVETESPHGSAVVPETPKFVQVNLRRDPNADDDANAADDDAEMDSLSLNLGSTTNSEPVGVPRRNGPVSSHDDGEKESRHEDETLVSSFSGHSCPDSLKVFMGWSARETTYAAIVLINAIVIGTTLGLLYSPYAANVNTVLKLGINLDIPFRSDHQIATVGNNTPTTGASASMHAVSVYEYPVHMEWLLPFGSIASCVLHFVFQMATHFGHPVKVRHAISLETIVHHATMVPVFAMITGTSSFWNFVDGILLVVSRMACLMIIRSKPMLPKDFRFAQNLAFYTAILQTTASWLICIVNLSYAVHYSDYSLFNITAGGAQGLVAGAIACYYFAIIVGVVGDIFDIVGSIASVDAHDQTRLEFAFALPATRFLTVGLILGSVFLKRSF